MLSGKQIVLLALLKIGNYFFNYATIRVILKYRVNFISQGNIPKKSM